MKPDEPIADRDSNKLERREFFNDIRRRRLIQINTATAVGLAISLTVSRDITQVIFASGLICLFVSLLLAHFNKLGFSAFVMLSALSSMLFALAATGAGVFDLAILGYPGLIIFGALLGGVVLFISVFLIVSMQSILLAYLSLQGIIEPNIPVLSVSHVLFILVIFAIIGFSVYILVNDIKRLVMSLNQENMKVEHSRAHVEYLANHDSLTKLPNRLYGETLFVRTSAHCKSNGKSLALLFLDLDNFKPINDALGHNAGDVVLEKLSNVFKTALPSDNQVIRFGGDEFIILAPFQTHEELSKLAKALIVECNQVLDLKQNQVVVSASIGIALAKSEIDDFKELCRKADIAMYRAKKNGKNTFCFYESILDIESEERFKLLQMLRPAVQEKAFTLFYQPIVDLNTNQVTSAEALLRWPQPDGSMIYPDEFIGLCESSGLINSLGAWVLDEACDFCVRQRSMGHADMRVAVNLSVAQFRDGQLNKIVQQSLMRSGLAPEALELELTESLLIQEDQNISAQIDQLSALGLSISIDDFGTGYSNLGYLRNFKASKLKIDRCFVSPISRNERDKLLVHAIINMAHSLGLEVVAEGIEDKEALKLLLDIGCDYGQGYFWTRPVCESEFMSSIS